MLRAVDLLLEYNNSKFHLSLPSRRQPVTETSSPPNYLLKWPNWELPVERDAKKDAKCVLDSQKHEYVYFEDLLATLGKKFPLLPFADGSDSLKIQKPNLATVTNYRCRIYDSNDDLSFDVLFRHDGLVLDTAPKGANSVSSNFISSSTFTSSNYSSPFGIDQTLVEQSASVLEMPKVPPKAIIFAGSCIYLFKDTFNLSCQLKPSALPKMNNNKPNNDVVFVSDIALDYYDELEGKKLPSVCSPPNFEHLPKGHLETSFSDDEDDIDWVKTPEGGVISSHPWRTRILDEMDDLYDIEEPRGRNRNRNRRRNRRRNGPSTVWPKSTQDRQSISSSSSSFNSSNLSFDLQRSMSTIYSEDTQQLISSEEEREIKAAIISDSSSSEDEGETVKEVAKDSLDGKKEKSTSTSLAKSRSLSSHRSEPRSLNSTSKQPQPKSQFMDPYEAPVFDILDPNCNIVYSDTYEIVSDSEEASLLNFPPPSSSSAESRLQGQNRGRSQSVSVTPQNTAQSDLDFGTLLGRLPLNDVTATGAYLREHLLLRREDIVRRETLVKRMEGVLKRHGLHCRLYIFGSTKNGLGLRASSDIDIFIQMMKRKVPVEESDLQEEDSVAVDESHLSFGSIKRVLEATDRILSDDQSYLDVLLDSSSDKSAYITMSTICHRHMRVPLTRLKIYQNTTMLQCDLNANNALGIANTRLLRFLCKLEPRFHALNVLLRFWAKTEADLNRPDTLSSYALSNLLLYFFQSRKPALLPSIDRLVRLSTSGVKIVNDWRCDFCKDLARLDWDCTVNGESLGTLLVGFFRFYSSFDFESVKISTRMGRVWRLRRVGGGRRGRGGLPSVHIMDPFEQSHNLTARMRKDKYEKMIREFGRAAELYAHLADTS